MRRRWVGNKAREQEEKRKVEKERKREDSTAIRKLNKMYLRT